MRSWIVLGAPLDSSGASRGERRAPAALRAAALIEALGVDRAHDAGDADAVLEDHRRDLETGLVGFDGLVAASRSISHRVGPLLGAEALPLIIGGDCAIMLGIAAALREVHDRVGLWFLDGHADFYDGESSPSGEGADMDLAILTGHGPPGLVDLAHPPLIAPQDVVLLGHRRPQAGPDVAEELGYLPPDLFHLDATSIAETSPGDVGHAMERRLAKQTGRVWLHLDLDVLDEAALPAVTYPQPGGLDWDALTALMRPLAASPALLGVSIADFNPDLDRNGGHARRIVQFLATVLTEERAPEPAAS